MAFYTFLEILLAAVVLYLFLSVLVRFGLISTIKHGAIGRNFKRRLEIAKSSLKKYPVKYVSERNHKLLRWVPWDASGTLTTSADGFHFEGNSPLGRRMEMSFNSDESTINYQKGSLLWDGGIPWCVIEVNGEKHYFTSEVADDAVLDSEFGEEGFGTTHIYRDLTNRYIKLN